MANSIAVKAILITIVKWTILTLIAATIILIPFNYYERYTAKANPAETLICEIEKITQRFHYYEVVFNYNGRSNIFFCRDLDAELLKEFLPLQCSGDDATVNEKKKKLQRGKYKLVISARKAAIGSYNRITYHRSGENCCTASALLSTGGYDRADIYLDSILRPRRKVTDDLAYSLEDYALAFEQRNDLDDCMAVYQKILELFPKSGGLAGDMAVMYQKHGKEKEWLEYARRAASMKDNDFLTNYNVASLISLAGSIDEGMKVFIASKDPSPLCGYYKGVSAACYFLGTIYLDQGKKKEGKELFESNYTDEAEGIDGLVEDEIGATIETDDGERKEYGAGFAEVDELQRLCKEDRVDQAKDQADTEIAPLFDRNGIVER
ncbi:unnamed protein product [Sphagnum jensenii]|uniref:Tetratricopeptide repeat protein n=1 Tax=Sphagnum jensenii TaxID=128206 RepID=A0ABP0VIL0_9BRYO